MERFRELGIIAFVVLTAAYGPELVVNRFYFSSWESDWVQAVSASVAVIVALLLPMYRDHKNDKKMEESRKEVETIAMFAIYHEALRLYEYFSRVESLLHQSDYGGLRDMVPNEDREDIHDHSRFDVSSSLGSRYAEHYYLALVSKMKLEYSIIGLIKLHSPAIFQCIGDRQDDGDSNLRDKAYNLAKEGKRVSEILITETRCRSHLMQS